MCIQSMKSIKYLLTGVIATITLCAWSSWSIAQPGGKALQKPQFAPSGASSVNQCVNFDGGGSMFLTREADGCKVDLNNVNFYQKPGCPKNESPKKGKRVNVGVAQCTGTSFGCDECVKQSKNSPYIIEFWNGTEMVAYCYDFDGPPQDCELPSGTACIHSAQCTSGNCSGGTCQ